jgi:competence protein ComEA
MSDKISGRVRAIVSVILLVIIVTGVIIILNRLPRTTAIEISLPPENRTTARITINGAVNNPGIYDLKAGDTIDAILQAAGGTTASAATDTLTLYVPLNDKTGTAQKVDLNRAESWLLEALPGIGEVLADRIVAYRQENGPFRNTNELIMVQGITSGTYEKIKDLITVTD